MTAAIKVATVFVPNDCAIVLEVVDKSADGTETIAYTRTIGAGETAGEFGDSLNLWDTRYVRVREIKLPPAALTDGGSSTTDGPAA